MPLQVLPTSNTKPADFSIFFNAAAVALRRLRKPTKVQLDTIEIDCTLNEMHTYESHITEFEVERGTNISDHRFIKPVEFSMTGIISDTPSDLNAIRESAELGAGLIGNEAAIITQTASDAIRATGNLISGDAVLTRQAFTKLLGLYTAGGVTVLDDNTTPPGVFVIVTKYRKYKNMVVRSLSFPRDRRTGDALQFSATFREIRIVSTKNAEFLTPMFQSTNPLGTLGGGEPSVPLRQEGSMAYHLFEGVSPGSLSSWMERAEIELGKKIVPALPENLGVFPMPPP